MQIGPGVDAYMKERRLSTIDTKFGFVAVRQGDHFKFRFTNDSGKDAIIAIPHPTPTFLRFDGGRIGLFRRSMGLPMPLAFKSTIREFKANQSFEQSIAIRDYETEFQTPAHGACLVTFDYEGEIYDPKTLNSADPKSDGFELYSDPIVW